MPRRKKPLMLLDSASCQVVTNVLTMCRDRPSELIRDYVSRIPSVLANDYMVMLLITASYDCFSSISHLYWAFHPKCSELDAMNMEELSSKVWYQLWCGLDAMSEITKLTVPSDDVNGIGDISKLTKLRHLNATLPDHPSYIEPIVRCCTQLETVQTHDISAEGMRVFAACKTLRVLDTGSELLPADIIMLLDSLPNLEKMRIGNIVEVVEQCTRTYNLKDFMWSLEDGEWLEKLVRHFPMLEVLNVDKTDAMLSPINSLEGLSSLQVVPKSEQIQDLAALTFVRLTTLGLHNARNPTAAFTMYYPLLVDLTLFACTDVDLAIISWSFPNLKLLEAEMSQFTSRVPLDRWRIQQLESVDLTACEISNVELLRILGPNMKQLYLDHEMPDATVLDLLSSCPMPHLKSLHIENNEMSEDVICTIIGSFDNLEEVLLNGDTLASNMTPELLSYLKEELRTYHLSVIVGGYDVMGDDEVD